MIKSGVLKGVSENKNGLRNRIAKMETTSKAMTGETADLEWCGNVGMSQSSRPTPRCSQMMQFMRGMFGFEQIFRVGEL